MPTYASAEAADAPSASETVAALESSTPEVLADERSGDPEPVVTAEGGELTVEGADVSVAIASDPVDGFTLASPGGPALAITPLGVDAGASDAKPVAGGEAVVSTSTDPGVSTVIKPQEAGISTYTVISGPEAPERYSWKVGDDQTITLNPDGGAHVLDAQGETIATIPVPWAKDKTGRELEGVHFETDGPTLTLVVPHRGQDVVYDVVADPSWWPTVWKWTKWGARRAFFVGWGAWCLYQGYQWVRGRTPWQDAAGNCAF